MKPVTTFTQRFRKKRTSTTHHSLVPHKFGKHDRSMNSNEINLQKRKDPQDENTQHLDHNCTYAQIHLLTSILSPTSQAVPMVFLTTTFARQHPFRSLASFIFNAITHSTKDLDIGLTQIFSINISWRILLIQPQVSNKVTGSQHQISKPTVLNHVSQVPKK